MARKRKNRHGHYCWSCDRRLPNERFSGRGHRRHLCKTCSRLGRDELAYRQAVRDVERCLDWDGRLRRKQRKRFESFRDHPDERVRRHVEKLEALWAGERREWRELRRQEEALEKAWEDELSARADVDDDYDEASDDVDDDEIPF